MRYTACMTCALPRIMIAAPASGGGKTTAVCGILGALARRGLVPCGIKCGPDYIDPMFHRAACGTSGNIDLFFADDDSAREILAHDAANCGVAVLEGAMGYFDGLGAASVTASAHDVARATRSPVALLVDAKSRALSVCADIIGAKRFRAPDMIRAVILNRCAPSLCKKLAPLIQAECGVPVLGCIPYDARLELPSRHLGLVLPGERLEVRAWLSLCADIVSENINLDMLLEIARSAPPLEHSDKIFSSRNSARTVIAVARDEAFCFYYRENLDLLSENGAVLREFSPLHDRALPAGTSALYIGGGYPELHEGALRANTAMLRALSAAAAQKMPVLAECGGLMYLQTAGILPGTWHDAGYLVRFGYCAITARRDTLLLRKNETLRAHEFHHYDSTDNGSACTAHKADGRTWDCIVAENNVFAGWPHLYFAGQSALAARFVSAARAFAERLLPQNIASAARARWNSLAKPLYGLGLLEEAVIRLCAVQRTLFPAVDRAALAVFCSDNGIVGEGVSQSGQEVTALVAQCLCDGTTAACKMAQFAGVDVVPVDVGMARAVEDARLRDMHVCRGTNSFLRGDAMTRSEAHSAITAGRSLARELAAQGYNLLLAGEMGIGNTTTSAAVASVLLGADPAELTGRGAGLDDERLRHKIDVIRQGIALRAPRADDVVDVLVKLGGCDIAAMAGFYLGAAECHVPVLTDGVISCTAALCAARLEPQVTDCLFAGHLGAEPACVRLAAELERISGGGFRPLVHAEMRLGEGTGALSAVPLLRMALAVYGGMQGFAEMGIAQYEDFGNRRK